MIRTLFLQCKTVKPPDFFLLATYCFSVESSGEGLEGKRDVRPNFQVGSEMLDCRCFVEHLKVG